MIQVNDGQQTSFIEDTILAQAIFLEMATDMQVRVINRAQRIQESKVAIRLDATPVTMEPPQA